MRVFRLTTPTKVTLFAGGAFVATTLTALAQEIDPDLPQIDPPSMDAGTDSATDAGTQVDPGNSSSPPTDQPADASRPAADSSSIDEMCKSVPKNPAPTDPMNPGDAPAICAEASDNYKPAGTKCQKYVPQFPLWSDNAFKERYVFIPTCGKISTSDDRDRWTFPVGTRFYKNFLDADNKTLLESRVITKVKDSKGLASWRFQTYRWEGNGNPVLQLDMHADDQGTFIGNDVPASIQKEARGSIKHKIPSMGDCSRCHSMSGKDAVIGFGALQLNGDTSILGEPMPYTLQMLVTAKQLMNGDKVEDASLVQAAKIPGDAVDVAGIGYLHGNCGNCHADGGEASWKSMRLRAAIGAATVADEPVSKTAVCQPSSQSGLLDVDVVDRDTYKTLSHQQMDIKSIIEGGQPEQSFVYARMSSRTFKPEPDSPASPYQNLNMPPIATEIPDEDHGLTFVKQWITKLPTCRSATAAQ